MLHRIFAYHLAALVLLTNISIPVFTHVCHGQGKAWSSVLLPARSCCKAKKEAKPAKACHPSEPSALQGIKPKPCCENHTGFLKTKSDCYNPLSVWVTKTFQLDFVALPFIDLPLCFSSFSQSGFSFQPHAPPVPRHGRSLLIFEQIFRC